MEVTQTEELVEQIKILSAKIDRLETDNVFKKPFWRVQDVALVTGWTRQTIYQKCSNGEIPYYKPDGKTLFFVPDEIRKYVLQNKTKSKEEIAEYIKQNF